MDPDRARRLAAEIDAAHRDGRLLDPITDREPLDLGGAYAVQRALTAMRCGRGRRRIGWKLGYTSAAMRAQMRVDAPNFGPLLDHMLTADGSPVSPDLVQPRVEPEVAVRLAADLAPGADRTAVLAALGEVRAALEVVDSVWRDYRFQLVDNTADGSSAAQVVLGPPVNHPAAELDTLPVRLIRNGEPVAQATGAAAMGHPLDALAWLITELAEHGERLREGDLVITGGLTAAVPIAAGDSVRAIFGSATEVSTVRAASGEPFR